MKVFTPGLIGASSRARRCSSLRLAKAAGGLKVRLVQERNELVTEL